MQRRSFLGRALSSVVGATLGVLSACGGGSRPARAGRGRILLAYFSLKAPMIMSTFAESYDFAGKTVIPVTTYAMSGLGTTLDDYAQSCNGARIGRGLAVRGEEVRSAQPAVDSWLRRAGLRDGQGAR